ncbi:hypothetical protein ACJX0J_012417, partial [Zea mays]
PDEKKCYLQVGQHRQKKNNWNSFQLFLLVGNQFNIWIFRSSRSGTLFLEIALFRDDCLHEWKEKQVLYRVRIFFVSSSCLSLYQIPDSISKNGLSENGDF